MFILKKKFEYNKYLFYVRHHAGICGFVLFYLMLGVDSLPTTLSFPRQRGSEVASDQSTGGQKADNYFADNTNNSMISAVMTGDWTQ